MNPGFRTVSGTTARCITPSLCYTFFLRETTSKGPDPDRLTRYRRPHCSYQDNQIFQYIEKLEKKQKGNNPIGAKYKMCLRSQYDDLIHSQCGGVEDQKIDCTTYKIQTLNSDFAFNRDCI